MNVKEVLESLGYSPKENGSSYQCTPLYRESDSLTVLSVDKNTGLWYDFKEDIGGKLEKLVKLTLKSSYEDAKKYLSNKDYKDEPVNEEAEIEYVKKWPKEYLLKLNKNHYYWNKRGVSSSTLSLFEGGVTDNGRMAHRYVFPIFDEGKNIIGFSGRDLIKSDIRPKWKIIGSKKDFNYPFFLNKDIIINSEQVILVESIGDMLALWENGIKNTLVVFGLKVHKKILKTLLCCSPKDIIISFNDDSAKSFAGNNAALKTKTYLENYFDPNLIRVGLPSIGKDFGEMSKEEIDAWKKSLNIYQPAE